MSTTEEHRDKAVADYQTTTELDPNDAVARSNLDAILSERGKTNEAFNCKAACKTLQTFGLGSAQ